MKLASADIAKLQLIGEAGKIVEAIMGADEFRAWWRATMLEDWNHDSEALEAKLFELTGTRDPKKVDLPSFAKKSK